MEISLTPVQVELSEVTSKHSHYMSMELSNNVVRKTLTLNLSRAQRCNKKDTHPRPDRTESPVTDAWSGLSRRIFPGIQAQCC